MTGRRTCHACGATYHVVMAPPKQEGLCDKCGGVLEQRKDDQPETVKHRLEIYHSQTEPLKGFYEEKGVLKRVPDLGGIEETNTKIMERDGYDLSQISPRNRVHAPGRAADRPGPGAGRLHGAARRDHP